MKSVFNMLRPLHFAFLFVAFAFFALSAAAENEKGCLDCPIAQSEVEPAQPNGNANDLETDATHWGYYGRPWRYGGWGGYGRGYGGWGGGYYGGWGGRGYGGWGGRGYGGYGGWGLGYWG